jgi:hypothetical protein
LGGPTPLRIRRGTAARPIEVEAYPGEHPLVAGLLWLDRPSYWTIDGLDVTWHTGDTENEHMVKVTNGVGWRLTNMVIWGAHSYADLLVAGTTTGRPANWRVDHDCIHTTYPTHPGIEDHNVYVNTGVTAGRGEIDHDVVFDAPNGENIKIGGASTTGGSANVLVADNTLFNAAQPILVAGRSHGITITGNLVDGALRRYVVRAFGLTGAQVDARRNLAYSAKRFIWNDAASATGIADAGGNVIAKGHAFEATDSCSAFTPRDALAKRYGAGD